jgi:hypothetical protein
MGMNTTTHQNLSPKVRTFKGTTRPGYHPSDLVVHADVTPGVSIRLYGTYSNNREGEARPFDKTYKVGDFAKYGSYNLIYDGKIQAITGKTVTIETSGTGGKVKRFDLHGFAIENHNYDRAKAERHNAEELLHI